MGGGLVLGCSFGFGVVIIFCLFCVMVCLLKLRFFGVERWSFVFWSSEGYVLGCFSFWVAVLFF